MQSPWLFALATLTLAMPVGAASPRLVVDNHLLPSPAAAGACEPQLARSPDGGIYLIWVEGTDTVKVAKLDRAGRTWSPAATVVTAAALALDPIGTPQFVADEDGKLTALWYEHETRGGEPVPDSSRAKFATSNDGGQHWSAARNLTDASASNEFAAIALLPNHQILAVWLDGRNRSGAGGAQALYSRILGATTADALVDPRVCDCCPTALAAFADGSALALFRDRADDETRDIAQAAWTDGAWQPTQPLSRDGWKINGCPVNGPALAHAGARTTAAWFTMTHGEAHVFACTSSTAGRPFFAPRVVDDGKPLGQVGAAELRDGTGFVSWLERGAAAAETYLLIREIHPDDSLSVSVRVATLARSARIGVPRIAVVQDEKNAPAELLVAYTAAEGDVTHVTTRLLVVQPTEPERPPCDTCPPEDQRGYPVHGYVRDVDAIRGLVRVKHDAIPGVMPAMTMRFHVAGAEIEALESGTEIYGRMEQREEGWWLFSVRRVAAAEKSDAGDQKPGSGHKS